MIKTFFMKGLNTNNPRIYEICCVQQLPFLAIRALLCDKNFPKGCLNLKFRNLLFVTYFSHPTF